MRNILLILLFVPLIGLTQNREIYWHQNELEPSILRDEYIGDTEDGYFICQKDYRVKNW